MKIIGFGYKKRVGKDTAVKFALSHLRQNYPHLTTCRVGFSEKIKDISCKMFGWGGLQDKIYYDNHPDEIEVILSPIGRTPRQIWDEMGNLGRGISEKVWVELAFQDLDSDIVLFDGVRFRTEIEYIRAYDGEIHRIDKADAPKSNHIVDHALDDYTEWNSTIDNNGTFKELNIKIKKLVDQAVERWRL